MDKLCVFWIDGKNISLGDKNLHWAFKNRTHLQNFGLPRPNIGFLFSNSWIFKRKNTVNNSTDRYTQRVKADECRPGEITWTQLGKDVTQMATKIITIQEKVRLNKRRWWRSLNKIIYCYLFFFEKLDGIRKKKKEKVGVIVRYLH